MAETFHNDINKVADMLLIGKDEFLKSYSYLSEEDYYETIRKLLYNNFSFEERKEYAKFLIGEGAKMYAETILPEVMDNIGEEVTEVTLDSYFKRDENN